VRIVQMSDLHVGEGLFRPELLSAAVDETNDLAPDLVVVAGDLTMEGYRGEFEQCRQFLDELACRHVVVTMGNHDARNVGYRHFEDFFGSRDSVTTVEVAGAARGSWRSTPPSPTSTRARSGASTTAGSTPSSVVGRRGPGSS
jgi:3',5'-cyclic-AMP phosphodiesterase